jgi:hypothetical protein
MPRNEAHTVPVGKASRFLAGNGGISALYQKEKNEKQICNI